MKNKKKIRERPIDNKKPFSVIKDLEKEKSTANNEQLTELNNIEKDLHKVLEYYDKIKKRQIPKDKISEKNEKGNNHYINNNIIYKNDNTSNLNNDEYKLNYKLTEFKRPNNYILYTSSKRNKINSIKKEYEAKEADFIFLNFKENFMTIEELENIIVDLENNVVFNKGEKIDEEKAEQIIETKYSKNKNEAISIINYFKDRRKTIKNSLIRKKWKRDKTFQKRKTDKIKTRKNIQNMNESLNKIIEAENDCKTNVLQIINSLCLKEALDQHLIKLNENIFYTECEKNKGMTTSGNRIKENNIFKKSIENIRKKLDDIILEDENVEMNNNSDKTNIENIIAKVNYNGNDSTANNNIKDNLKNENNNTPANQGSQIINNNDVKTIKNKNISKNKNEVMFPSISLETLKNKNMPKDKLSNKNGKCRFRIRLNRINKIVVDRYVELKDDTNPFHDSFNKIIKKYQHYDYCPYNELKNNNFENLLNCYNSNIARSLPLDESDDESTTFKDDIKQFSNSYKHFLKLKRANII